MIDGDERVLEFASRTLSAAERNYSVTERECVAILWAIKKFRPYIETYGFKIITDHSSLKWLRDLQNPTGRLARWALELQNHSFTVEHRKSSLNNVPDALSRMFEEEEPAVAALELTRDTNDHWYLKTVKEVQQQPRDFPTFKLVGGDCTSTNWMKS